MVMQVPKFKETQILFAPALGAFEWPGWWRKRNERMKDEG
jgi:hypothetical protein